MMLSLKAVNWTDMGAVRKGIVKVSPFENSFKVGTWLRIVGSGSGWIFRDSFSITEYVEDHDNNQK